MNPAATSKEEILKISRQIAAEQGFSAITMRTVASGCGVAVGSIYHYYPSKADLLGAVVESIWKDILHMTGRQPESLRFIDCVSWLFERITESSLIYPEFFTIHSLLFSDDDKSKVRKLMEQSLAHMQKQLLQILQEDPHVRANAFSAALLPAQFVDDVVTLLISHLLQKKKNCQSLLQLIQNCIY